MSRAPYTGDGQIDKDSQNLIDCVHCGTWFPTFDRLATHMAARHGPPVPHHRKDQIVAKRTRTPRIRPQARQAPVRRGSSGIPTPNKNTSSDDFNAFLKADDIGAKIGSTATLTLTGETRMADGNFGEQIICEVKLGRSVYDWGITIDSVNHRLLFDRFGKDPRKWRGRVDVVVKMSRQNRPYVAVLRKS